MSKVSYFTSGNNPKDPKTSSIDEMLSGIKEGTWQDKTLNYRVMVEKHGKDDDRSKKYKVSIPGFTVSGTFSHRSNKSLIAHSGFIAVDIDGVTGDVQQLKQHIEKDEYTYSCFISVGGRGLCVIMKVDPNQHGQELFEHIQDYYLENFEIEIDFLADVARFRFVSFDPDLTINEESETFSFTPDTTRQSLNGQLEQAISEGIDSQIKLAESLVQREIQYEPGARHRYIYNLAKLLNKMGISKDDATNYIYTTYPHFAENPSNAITWTYGVKKSQFGDWKKPEKKKENLQTLEELAEKFSFLESFDGKDKPIWFIDAVSFWKWLYTDLGICTYNRGEDKLIVRIKDNIITALTREQMKSFVYHYFETWPVLQRKIINSKKKLLNKDSVPYFFDLGNKIDSYRDPMNESILFFNNGYVKVDKENIGQPISYSELDFKIWDTDILERDYKEEDYTKGDFYKFCINITNKNPDRLDFLMTSIGYYMHTYKNPSVAKSIVLVDEGSDPDKANGGTGKTLIVKALSKMRETVVEDGKNFGSRNSQFMYQKIMESTKILSIDDVSRRFPWDKLFSVITTGIDIEKKRMTAYTMPFSEAPKILPTTNFMVKDTDESTKRRFIELEVYPYYSSRFTPIDEFKRNFFSEEWEESDWNQFYSFMLECLRLYLEKGICVIKTKSAPLSKLKTATNSDFADFSFNHYKNDVEYDFKEERESFLLLYPDYVDGRNKLTEKKWSLWLKKLADCKGWDFHKVRTSYRDGGVIKKKPVFQFFINPNNKLDTNDENYLPF